MKNNTHYKALQALEEILKNDFLPDPDGFFSSGYDCGNFFHGLSEAERQEFINIKNIRAIQEKLSRILKFVAFFQSGFELGYLKAQDREYLVKYSVPEDIE